MNTRFREAAPDVSSYIKVTTENKAVVDLTALPEDQAERIRRNAKAAYGAEISEDGNQATFPDYQEAENCLVYIFTNADVIADNIQESINNGTLPQDISMILDADLRRGMARRVLLAVRCRIGFDFAAYSRFVGSYGARLSSWEYNSLTSFPILGM